MFGLRSGEGRDKIAAFRYEEPMEREAPDEEEGETELCFVCCTDTGEKTFRVCHCRQYIHEACFQQLVTTVAAHSDGCPVCQHAYTVSVQWVPDKVLRVVVCAMLLLLNAVLLAWSLSIWSRYYNVLIGPFAFLVVASILLAQALTAVTQTRRVSLLPAARQIF